MNAVELIEKLIKGGVSLADAFKKANAKDGVQWDEFLSSDAYKTVRELIDGVLGQFTGADVDVALARVRQKQAAILNGRTVLALSLDELSKFDSLLTTESLLQDKLLATIGNKKSLWEWLAKEGAPALLKLAPIVLPLLL